MPRATRHPLVRALPAALLALLATAFAPLALATTQPPAGAAHTAQAAVSAHVVPWHIGALLVGLVVTAGLLRRFVPKRSRRIRATALLFIVYAVTLLLGAGLEVLHVDARATQAWWFAELLETFIGINLGAILFFDLALMAVKVQPASIVSDLVIGAAYIVSIIQDMHRAGVNPSSIVATSAVVSGVLSLSLAPTIGNILGGVALQLDNSISE
ncbi:MAG: hypothetical protein WCJ30_27755, partial [Deltaproteobacteria bacterium]